MLAPVTLEDKYRLEQGRVFLTGVQALARLPMLQHARDRAAGLNTAGYVSGYRGSPLGGLDTALHDAQRFLAGHNIKFQPGVNEDLGRAEAVAGDQAEALQGLGGVEDGPVVQHVREVPPHRAFARGDAHVHEASW